MRDGPITARVSIVFRVAFRESVNTLHSRASFRVHPTAVKMSDV